MTEYINKSNITKGVIGLSGGLDSSVMAYISVNVFGKDNVYGLILPSDSNSDDDNSHGKQIAKTLGLRYDIINIDPIVTAFKESSTFFDRDILSSGNLKARIRMCLLYGANEPGGIVIGTDNKSENLIGYFTKYGDGGVDINPLENLYKTQVRMLAKNLNVPDTIISKPPTAGLWKNQTDESEIGLSYETLDSILFGKELNFSNSEIKKYAKVSEEDIKRAEDLERKSKHKRELPPGPTVINYV